MATHSFFQYSLGRAGVLALLSLFPIIDASAQSSGASLAERELARRSTNMVEARELLQKGDEAYEAEEYADAVQAYAGARELIPDAPATAELRRATTDRYAQAAAERARRMVRVGDLDGAKRLLDQVLTEGVAEGHPYAAQTRAELEDPIRTNPALTAEHVTDVDEVRRKLYTAEGAYALGKYDQANELYGDVLQIDPTNSAARRGMERVAQTKLSYFSSAFDQTRAELLGQVEQSWELPIPPTDLVPPESVLARLDQTDASRAIHEKVHQIVIPRIRLEDATLEDAIELLRIRTRELDPHEDSSGKRGIDFALNLGPSSSPKAQEIRSRRINLQLNQVPVAEVLRHLTSMTGTSYRVDDYAVEISAVGGGSDQLVIRTYRVPPNFLATLTASASEGSQDSQDIFGSAPASGGLLPQRMGVQEALKALNIPFPDGASANLSGATNTLRVLNTPANQETIYQIVESVAQSEPTSVEVRITMIDIQRTALEELGFDWMLDSFGAANVSGGQLVLSGGSQGNGGSFADMNLSPSVAQRNPVTAGNRSGQEAFTLDSIDQSIANAFISGTQQLNRAPGILGFSGFVDDGVVQMLMRGMSQKKNTDVVAKPSVVTRSGQAASIVISREFLYPTEYDPPELPNNVYAEGGGSFPVTPAHPTAFEKRDVGVVFEILPEVDADKRYVDLKLAPTFVEFDGFVNYGSPIMMSSPGTLIGDLLGLPTQIQVSDNRILMPVFSTNRVDTQVSVADGATVVVGGLLRSSVETVNDKTPILGDLPIVGRLFQSTGQRPMERAVLFLVNVRIVDPTGRSFHAN